MIFQLRFAILTIGIVNNAYCSGFMKINYNRLWKLLIDREMTRTDLRLAARISTYTLARLGKNQEVTLTTLRKITAALDCSLDDIVDFVPEAGKRKNLE